MSDDADLKTDVLVIGGGIMGCSAAYFLARAGVDVLLIDRHDLNTQGSGTNAGSIHVQIISRFFKSADPLWVRGRAALLPLLKEAVSFWQRFAPELDDDVELRIGGGLMVAENETELRVLESKVAVERAQGVNSELLDRKQLEKLAPYLAPSVLGAELCPLEGKVNPIRATPAIARGAVRAGARIRRGVTLHSLNTDKSGFEAVTSIGRIRARRVVNAAGPWCNEVAAMVGLSIPLERHARNMSATEPVEPFVMHLIQHADQRLTLKQVSNGNLLLGGGWPAVIDPASGRANVIRTGISGGLWIATHVVPRIRHLRLIRAWSGILFFTPDGNPVLGEAPGVPGFFNAVGPNAGYTGGPLCGKLVAEAVTGQPLSFDVRSFDLQRFESRAA